MKRLETWTIVIYYGNGLWLKQWGASVKKNSNVDSIWCLWESKFFCLIMVHSKLILKIKWNHFYSCVQKCRKPWTICMKEFRNFLSILWRHQMLHSWTKWTQGNVRSHISLSVSVEVGMTKKHLTLQSLQTNSTMWCIINLLILDGKRKFP